MYNAKPTQEAIEQLKPTHPPNEYLFGNLSCIWFVILFFISIGLLATFGMWRDYTELKELTRLRNQGIVVEGKVTDLYKKSSGGSGTYHVVYEYEALNSGEPTRFTQDEEVSSNIYAPLEFGGRINVIYAENDPGFARVEQEFNSALARIGQNSIGSNPLYAFIGLSIAFTVTFFFGLLRGIRSQRWAKKLAAEGVVTQAKIFKRWKQKEKKDSKVIHHCVAYRFEASSPTGGTVKRFSKAEINYCAYKHLESGSVVSVRYLPEQPEFCRLELDGIVNNGSLAETDGIENESTPSDTAKTKESEYPAPQHPLLLLSEAKQLLFLSLLAIAVLSSLIWFFSPLNFSNNCFAILGVLALFFAIIGAIVGGAGYIEARKLNVQGKDTQAILLDRWRTKDDDKLQYCIAYQFDALLPGGESQQFTRVEFNREAYKRFEVGSTVPVRYLPENPEICRLKLYK